MTKIILAADVGGTTCKLGIFTPELEQLHKMVYSHWYIW